MDSKSNQVEGEIVVDDKDQVECEGELIVQSTTQGLQAPTDQAIAPIVQMAMDRDLDEAKLQKLLDIQIAYERREAEKAYHAAVAEFKKVAPIIDKNATVNYVTDKGTVQYNHATLGYSLTKITPKLSEFELSLSWVTGQGDGKTIVTARLTHSLGHYEETTLSAAPDNSGGKNAIQAIKSSVTYLQRTTAFSLLGLAETDTDTDGIPVDVEEGDVLPVNEEQLASLRDLLSEIGKAEEQLVRFINAKKRLTMGSLSDLPESQYDAAVKFLESQRKE